MMLHNLIPSIRRDLACLAAITLLVIGIAAPSALGAQVVEQWRSVAAGSYGNVTDFEVDAAGNSYALTATGGNVVLVKYNSAGVEQWLGTFDANGNDVPTAMAVDAAGNTYFVGYTDGVGSGVGTNFMLFKISSAGVEQWRRFVDSVTGDDDYGFDLALDALGNPFVTGYSVNSVTSTDRDYLTAMFSAAGVEIWRKVENTPGAAIASAIAIDGFGDPIVTGTSAGTYLTIKYDTSLFGQEIWRATVAAPPTGSQSTKKVALDPSNNVYVSGFRTGGTGNFDYYLVKYNAAGALQWSRANNSIHDNSDTPSAMAVDSAGNIYVTGTANTATGLADYMTVKHDPNGVEIFEVLADGSSNHIDQAYDIAVDNTGASYVTGRMRNVHELFNQRFDYATIKYSTSGSLVWQVLMDRTTNDSGIGVGLDAAGQIYVTGVSSSALTTVMYAPPVADIGITKTDGLTSVAPGTTLTYTIVATNSGPNSDPAVSLADTLPADLTCTYTSVAAGSATGNTASGSGDLAESLSMPSGSTVTYTVDCTIDGAATGTLSNTATVTASVTDPNAANNSATDGDTVLVPQADLEITKTDGVASAIPGSSLTYTVAATNNGPNADPAVSLADTLPSDLSCTYTSLAAGGASGNTASGAGDLAETLSMPASSSVTYTVDCTIDSAATGTLSNTASVSASITDPNGTNNSATDNDTLLSPQADLEVTKTDGLTWAAFGSSLTYTIVATNNGPSDDPSVSLADTLPADLTCTFTSAAAGGATGNTASGSGDLAETLSMPSGSSVTYTVDCAIHPAATGTLSNTATVAASVTDNNAGNDSATDNDTVLVAPRDYGDAPDPTYPTLDASNGAAHTIGALFLGASVDQDANGQPNATATGDDVAGTDDEDGVTFTSSLAAGATTTVDVVASGSGWLNAWVDFNNDGDWADSGEQIFSNQAVTAGTNNLSFAVPASASFTPSTFARFRVDSAGSIFLPTGLAADGEVEDYSVEILRPSDYGDAPDPFYPTLKANNGAHHPVYSGIFLGANVDTDPDGQPTTTADGDVDDGVAFTSTIDSGTTATVDVTASTSGLLSAWIDFNDDGDWDDAGEQIFTDEALSAGVNGLNFAVPAGLIPADTFARFRFSTAGGLSPDGSATDGEVEDYPITVTGSAPFELRKTIMPSRPFSSSPLFGLDLARSGDTLIVGAHGTRQSDYVSGGAAYIFARNHPVAGYFGETRELIAPNPENGAQFGRYVAIDGDIAVVSEPNKDLPGKSDAGAAYVFARNQGGAGNWGLIKTLQASDPTAGRYFGASVSVSGDTIAIGRANHNEIGAAYVFERNQGGTDNWGQVTRIVSSLTTSSDLFGFSIDLDGDTLVVGANGSQSNGGRRTFVFYRDQGGSNNWGELAIIPGLAPHFLELDGDRLAVRTSIFERDEGGPDNWGLVATAVPSASTGRAVALGGDILGNGRSSNNSPPYFELFNRDKNGPDQWGPVALLDTGATPNIQGMGLSVASDLVAAGAPGDSKVYLYAPTGSPATPELDFGDAPDDPYPTLLANDPAAHVLGSGLYLGATVDGDPNGQPTDDADGDDIDGTDDDDGVVFTSAIISDFNATLDVTASAAGLLNAWLDFNDDGDWSDPGEQILTDEPLGSGVNSLQFAVPTGLTASATVARFRFDSSGGLSYDGVALDGEVEDYLVTISGPNPFGQLKELTASNPNAGMFGAQIDRSGNTLAVAAKRADTGALFDNGAVYLFERNQGGADNWGEVKEITQPTPASWTYFGTSLAIGGNTLVVGTDQETVEGVAHVYERNQGGAGNWGWIATLAPSVATDRGFGTSVAIDGDRIVVGGTLDSSAGPGAVYIFERNQGGADNWGEVKRLTASDGTPAVLNYFGSAVSLDGTRLAVGARDAAFSSGAVYIFEKDEGGVDNWGEKKIVTSDNSYRLGTDVEIQGDRLATGEHQWVRVFGRNEGGTDNWGELTSFHIPDAPVDNERYGEVVDLDGDLLGTSDNRQPAGYIHKQNKNGPDAWGWLDKVSTTATAEWNQPAGLSVRADLVALGAPGSNKVVLYVPAPGAQFDYGDAPDPTYPTLAASSGATHHLSNGLLLGATVDNDADGQPNATATGDDGDGTDDEDGVTFTSTLVPGASTTLDVVATSSGMLNAWIDFNDDGDWEDSGEQIFADQAVTSGTNGLMFTVPAGASGTPSTFARFRLDSNGGLLPTGPAGDGEVEDYEVAITSASPPTADAGLDRSLAPNNQSIMLGGTPAASGGTPGYSYSWSVTPGVAGIDYMLSSATAANPAFTGLTEQVYTATLTVTDSTPLQDMDDASITVVVPNDRDLFNEDLTGTETYEACTELTAEMVVIKDGSDITFIAPAITLLDGFIVEDGATFTAVIGTPSSCGA